MTLVERSEVRKVFAIRIYEDLQRNSFHCQLAASHKRIPRKTKVITSILKSTFTHADGNWKTVFSDL